MKKILLIGDSIRIGYDKYTKMALEDCAEVYFPEENCRFTGYILRFLHNWKGDLHLDDDVDLVHWNAGLWDNLLMLDGKANTTIEVYKENVGRICTVIKYLFPKAKIIFATSTPCIEAEIPDGVRVCTRYNKDTEAYNAAAIEVIKEHGGEINDLYTLMSNAPEEYHSDPTHYYTKEATKLITEQVVAHIEKALGIKGKELDYDKLFKEETNIIGH